MLATPVKYPRTFHVPWSEGATDDDRRLVDMSAFAGQAVVVTEKMDGENTTLYRDGLHARSLDGRSHVSRDWVKQFWSGLAADIPTGWRVCGENLYARHSIFYQGLASYFMGFSVWNDTNECLSWSESLTWFSLLGITPVPVLYEGCYDETAIRSLYTQDLRATQEGYVIRLAGRFAYNQFRCSVAKFVRQGHVTTARHWMTGAVERNLLAP